MKGFLIARSVFIILVYIIIAFIIIRSCLKEEKEKIKADLEVFPESGTEPLLATIKIKASSNKLINEIKVDFDKDGKWDFEDFPKTKEYSNELSYIFSHPTGELSPASVTVVALVLGAKERLQLEKTIIINPLSPADFALLADKCSGVPPLEVNFQVVFFSISVPQEKLIYFWDCDGDGIPDFVNNSTQQTCRFDRYGLYPSNLSILNPNSKITESKFIYCGIIAESRITRYIEVLEKMEIKKYFAIPKQVRPTDILQDTVAFVGIPQGIFIVDLKQGNVKNWVVSDSDYESNWASFLDPERVLSATLEGIKLHDLKGESQLILEGESRSVFPFTVTDNFGNSSTFFVFTYRFPRITTFPPCEGETCGFFLCEFQPLKCYGMPLPSEVLSFSAKDKTSKLDVFIGHNSLIKAFRIKKFVDDLKTLSDLNQLIEFEKDYPANIVPYIFDAVLDSSENLKASILPYQASPYFQIFIPPDLISFSKEKVFFNTTSFISDDLVFLGASLYPCKEGTSACSGLVFDINSNEFKYEIESESNFLNSYYENNILITSTESGMEILKLYKGQVVNKSSINFIPYVEDFYLEGSTVYIAAGKGGAFGLDIFSDKFLFHIPTTDAATAISKSGDLVLIGVSDDLTTSFKKEGKLILYDIKTGKKTVYSDKISESIIDCLSLYQDHIILCAGNVLKKFTLSFSEVSNLELQGIIKDIKFHNGKIFVITDKNLYTIDFYSFNIIDTKTTQRQFFQMDIYPERNLLFTAEGVDNAFSIWDISTGFPSRITSFSLDYKVLNDIAGGIAHWGDRLYVASAYSGAMIFDISDPLKIRIQRKTHFETFSIPLEKCYSSNFKLICKSVKDLIVLE
jgi:WD40 repeat protein